MALSMVLPEDSEDSELEGKVDGMCEMTKCLLEEVSPQKSDIFQRRCRLPKKSDIFQRKVLSQDGQDNQAAT